MQLLEMALARAAALPLLLLPFLAVTTCLDVPSHGNALRSNHSLVRNKQLPDTFWRSELGLLLLV